MLSKRIHRVSERDMLRATYRHLPCIKCQSVGNYKFEEGKIICMSCGRELKKF